MNDEEMEALLKQDQLDLPKKERKSKKDKKDKKDKKKKKSRSTNKEKEPGVSNVTVTSPELTPEEAFEEKALNIVKD